MDCIQFTGRCIGSNSRPGRDDSQPTRWTEAAAAIRQGENEPLSSLLPKTEGALTRVMTEEATSTTDQTLYVLLKGSLNEKTLEQLDTKFGFTRRVRELAFLENWHLLRSLLHRLRTREVPTPAIRAVTTTRGSITCRTCGTSEHSYLTCDMARAAVRCGEPDCHGAKHFLKEYQYQ